MEQQPEKPSGQQAEAAVVATSKLDLSNVRKIDLGASLARPGVDPITEIGSGLTRNVICILSGYLVLAVIVLFVTEWRESNYIADLNSRYACATDASAESIRAAIATAIERAQNLRSAWLDFHKLVIVNVLLPLITALLGYVFGSRNHNSSD